MASIGHVVVGMAAGRFWPRDTGLDAQPARSFRQLAVVMAGLAILSLLPDGDVIAFTLGIPYENQFGHRGATHSIAFAIFCGVIAFAIAHSLSDWRIHRREVGGIVFAIVISHALLDALTDGGLGVALFWPFTDERYFAPWRPLPVAPIGRRFFLTAAGWRVAATEIAFFFPALMFALWPRRANRRAVTSSSTDRR